MNDQSHPSRRDLEATPLDPAELMRRALNLVRRALRRWPVLLLSALVAVAAFVMVPKFVKPRYASQTVLLYRELIQTTSVLRRDSGSGESSRQRRARLRDMLVSRTNLEGIITDLSLYPRMVDSRGMVDAVEHMRKFARVNVGESDAFTISYEGEDPDVVFAVTQQLAQSLIAQVARYRAEQADNTRRFLEAQTTRTKNQLYEKEAALATFLATHPEFALDEGGGAYSAGASVRAAKKVGDNARAAARVNPTLLALQRQRSRLVQALEQATQGGSAKPKPRPQPTVSIPPQLRGELQNAQREEERARANLETAKQRYTPKHPDVAAARRRYDQARARLNTVKAQVAEAEAAGGGNSAPVVAVPTTKADRERLKADLKDVEAQLRAARGAGAKVDDEEVPLSANPIVVLETEWAALNREVDAVRDRSQEIERRLFEARIMAKVAGSGGAAQMVVVDQAYRPKRPSRLGPRRTGAVAALIVLMLGALIALALALLDDRIYDSTDLERFDLPFVLEVAKKA